MAAKRAPDEPLRLRDLFGVVSTETAREWATAECSRARELCEQADAEVRRSRRFRAEVRPRPVDPTARTMRARLQAAELNARNLEKAQLSNRRIGMALGILMCRHSLAEEQALEALRAASSHRNMRLRELAEDVIYTGDLHETRVRRPPRPRSGDPVRTDRPRQRA